MIIEGKSVEIHQDHPETLEELLERELALGEWYDLARVSTEHLRWAAAHYGFEWSWTTLINVCHRSARWYVHESGVYYVSKF